MAKNNKGVNTTKNINVAHLTNVKISNILIKIGIIKYSVQQREKEILKL